MANEFILSIIIGFVGFALVVIYSEYKNKKVSKTSTVTKATDLNSRYVTAPNKEVMNKTRSELFIYRFLVYYGQKLGLS